MTVRMIVGLMVPMVGLCSMTCFLRSRSASAMWAGMAACELATITMWPQYANVMLVHRARTVGGFRVGPSPIPFVWPPLGPPWASPYQWELWR